MVSGGLPGSLGEAVAAPGHSCPIPFAHDRLNECHYWWHEIARNYHEPDPMRFSLGAFIQAARNVTFMVQSQKAVFSDFTWYEEWVKLSKNSDVLRWVHATRTNVVHREALQAQSWMRIRCVRRGRVDEDDVAFFEANPFVCTHYYVHHNGHVEETHSHEVIRHWGVQDLPRRELLEVAGEIHGMLNQLISVAHQQVGHSVRTAKREAGQIEWLPDEDRLPCMQDHKKYQIAKIKRRKGKLKWVDEPPGLHAG